MKRKMAIAFVLALLMVLAVLPAQGVLAESTAAIAIDTTAIETGHTVWFGTYGNEPIQWRVLGNGNDGGGNSKLLLSDRVLDTVKFKEDASSQQWQGSTAQQWCKDFYNGAFTEIEKTAIIKTTKGDDAFNGGDYPVAPGILQNDDVFFISAGEASSSPFGAPADRIAQNLQGNTSSWWLRSPHSDLLRAGNVDAEGNLTNEEIGSGSGARPAFNINTNTYHDSGNMPVLFRSPAVGGKVSGSLGAGALAAVPSTETTDWKLTLVDPNRGFDITNVRFSSLNLAFDYENATVGDNEYISVVVLGLDENNKTAVFYYGRVAQLASSSGTLSLDLSGISDERATCIHFFSEQCNGDKKTDYAGELSNEFNLNETFHYAITNNLTDITSDNDAIFHDKHISPTEDEAPEYNATLTAAYGYTLPETIEVWVGDNKLTGGYTYDSTSGALAIAQGVINGNVEIKASGKPIIEAITFDPAGGTWGDGTGEQKTIRAQRGSEITIAEAPTKKGYTFQHWEGSVYQPGQKYTVPEGGHTFTARWKKSPTDPTDPSTPDDAPTTGENIGFFLWPGLLLFAIGAILLVLRKKNNAEQKS